MKSRTGLDLNTVKIYAGPGTSITATRHQSGAAGISIPNMVISEKVAGYNLYLAEFALSKFPGQEYS